MVAERNARSQEWLVEGNTLYCSRRVYECRAKETLGLESPSSSQFLGSKLVRTFSIRLNRSTKKQVTDSGEKH